VDVISLGAQIGFIFCPFALGVYLALRVLSLPDLTLEGSFGIGGAIAATMLINGADPITPIIAGSLGGAVAGLVTAFMHLRLRMNVLLAGIIVTTGAWSVVIMIMGAGNVGLLDEKTVFTWAQDWGLSSAQATLVVGAVVTALFSGLLVAFLHTEYGLSMRASGMNIQTARGMGIRTEARQAVGLALANALSAASGALLVEQQGFMDVSISAGIIVIGLAALMIGQAIIHSPRPILAVLSAVLGAVIYRTVIAWALDLGLDPNYVKLITALVVSVVIAARNVGRGAFALPWTSAGERQRRQRHQYYEDDKVSTFV
jgi:putative ABC transport system permease protein